MNNELELSIQQTSPSIQVDKPKVEVKDGKLTLPNGRSYVVSYEIGSSTTKISDDETLKKVAEILNAFQENQKEIYFNDLTGTTIDTHKVTTNQIKSDAKETAAETAQFKNFQHSTIGTADLCQDLFNGIITSNKETTSSDLKDKKITDETNDEPLGESTKNTETPIKDEISRSQPPLKQRIKDVAISILNNLKAVGKTIKYVFKGDRFSNLSLIGRIKKIPETFKFELQLIKNEKKIQSATGDDKEGLLNERATILRNHYFSDLKTENNTIELSLEQYKQAHELFDQHFPTETITNDQKSKIIQHILCGETVTNESNSFCIKIEGVSGVAIVPEDNLESIKNKTDFYIWPHARSTAKIKDSKEKLKENIKLNLHIFELDAIDRSVDIQCGDYKPGRQGHDEKKLTALSNTINSCYLKTLEDKLDSLDEEIKNNPILKVFKHDNKFDSFKKSLESLEMNTTFESIYNLSDETDKAINKLTENVEREEEKTLTMDKIRLLTLANLIGVYSSLHQGYLAIPTLNAFNFTENLNDGDSTFLNDGDSTFEISNDLKSISYQVSQFIVDQESREKLCQTNTKTKFNFEGNNVTCKNEMALNNFHPLTPPQLIDDMSLKIKNSNKISKPLSVTNGNNKCWCTAPLQILAQLNGLDDDIETKINELKNVDVENTTNSEQLEILEGLQNVLQSLRDNSINESLRGEAVDTFREILLKTELGKLNQEQGIGNISLGDAAGVLNSIFTILDNLSYYINGDAVSNTKFIFHDLDPDQPKIIDNENYEARGIIYNSRNFHFTSKVKDNNGNWYDCNDSIITEIGKNIDLEPIEHDKKKAKPVLIIYQKKE